jgi:hypothetical protein
LTAIFLDRLVLAFRGAPAAEGFLGFVFGAFRAFDVFRALRSGGGASAARGGGTTATGVGATTGGGVARSGSCGAAASASTATRAAPCSASFFERPDPLPRTSPRSSTSISKVFE